MMQVWLLFKIIETILGSIGMIYHFFGFKFNPDEPLPHLMICCGTFFGFTVVSLMGIIKVVVGGSTPVLVECVINYTAALLYILISIISMHFAEMDFHLMYLSDFEEPVHPYFSFSRSQSICALAAGAVHLLNGILATDVLVSKGYNERFDMDSESTVSTVSSVNMRTQWRMYFLSKYVEDKLRRFTYFDKLCRRETLRLSMFSFSRKSVVMSVGKADKKLSSGKSFFKEPIPKKESKKEQIKNKMKLFKKNSDYEFEEVLKVSKFRGSKQERDLSFTSDNTPVSEIGSSSVSALRFLEANDERNDNAHIRTSKEMKNERPQSILRSSARLTTSGGEPPDRSKEEKEKEENQENQENQEKQDKEEQKEQKEVEKENATTEEQKEENTETKSRTESSNASLSSEAPEEKKPEKKGNLRFNEK